MTDIRIQLVPLYRYFLCVPVWQTDRQNYYANRALRTWSKFQRSKNR